MHVALLMKSLTLFRCFSLSLLLVVVAWRLGHYEDDGSAPMNGEDINYHSGQSIDWLNNEDRTRREGFCSLFSAAAVPPCVFVAAKALRDALRHKGRQLGLRPDTHLRYSRRF